MLTPKLVTFALRRNRLKNRNLWDIGWLKQQNITLPVDLVWKKVADRHHDAAEFINLLSERVDLLLEDSRVHQSFVNEMKRFLLCALCALCGFCLT